MARVNVSLVVPIFNVERYIRECLDSVVAQTLGEIEILCIDDGSTDASGKIADEYASRDSRIRVVHKQNQGYGKAVNDGVRLARGEYIGIVEPDDWIEPDMYETLYGVASSHGLDLVKSDHYEFTVDPGGSEVSSRHVLTYAKENYGKVFDLTRDYLPYRFSMYTWTGIYRRQFLLDNDIWHHETPGASFQDQGFWLQTFFHATRAMFIDGCFYHYRKDNPNSSTLSKGKVRDIIEEYAFIESKLWQLPEAGKGLAKVFVAVKFGNYYASLKRIGAEFREEFIAWFRKEYQSYMERGLVDFSRLTRKDRKNLRLLLNSPSKLLEGLDRTGVTPLQQLFCIKSINGQKTVIVLGKHFTM